MSLKNTPRTLILLALVGILIATVVYAYNHYRGFLPAQVQHEPVLSLEQQEQIKTHSPISEIRVYKAKRELQLISGELVIRCYPMRLGFSPQGHKQQEGDGKTPEGRYMIDWRNSKSAFYKSLHVSYPNTTDRAAATARGVSAGGDIMIHGSTNSKVAELPNMMQYLPEQDWTLGCIAVRNVDIDEIWKLVENNIPIVIYP
ncbi:L,D-transpeptidase-like protein [Acinetobacter calcoaceticus]|uniref:L,D-transpeptidase-like protein n=1 Tax=Acinetobacter calcoaceticus TaxID=471 RepID=A0A4R1XUF4_ACICA|nr:L,D-transpeptidase-like protein [Acinetobacter calcoaceticus]